MNYTSIGIRRGFFAGLMVTMVLLVAMFPARLSVALRGWGSVLTRAERALVGTLLDLSAVVLLIAPLVALATFLIPLLVKRFRSPRWQRLGAVWCTMPFGFAFWVLTVVAQEVKSERGSFPTVFDLLEGGTNASFVEGTLGFLRYERVWLPAIVGTLGAGFILLLIWRRPLGQLGSWSRWVWGTLSGLGVGATGVLVVTLALAALANRFTAAALGDPLTGLVESGFDFMRHQGPATPRELVLDAQLPAEAAAQGATLLGWPPSKPTAVHLHQRPLDFSEEPVTRDPRGTALLRAFEKVGQALFDENDSAVALFQLSLEGFRADDVHALNAAAPLQIAPFVSSLYGKSDGVLTSSKMFQAGVRTAHCLGAMTCGLGTLPYNLSFIRDLQPFPVRCASDVLHDAGFHHSFFYGSDGTFDDMKTFFSRHGFTTVVTQAELPKTLPKGTWDGVTDFAVFDEAVKTVAAALAEGPQFSLLMSLSNHSPFTSPADLPAEVSKRVDLALAQNVNRADADDRLRLITYSYTDAAVQRFFESLETAGIAERSIAIVLADHSTGHSYVWGAEAQETDAAKAQIPFAIVIPAAFVARAKKPAAFAAAMKETQKLFDEAPLSQNDVPALVLALMKSHPRVAALPASERWHTLGGQVTSPWYRPGGDSASYIVGINGVSELFALDRQGKRVGSYEDSVFLKTRADRYRVTPQLIPITATLIEVMKQAP